MKKLRRLASFLIIIFIMFSATVNTDELPGSMDNAIETASQSSLISVINNFGQNPQTERSFTWQTSSELNKGFIEYCPKEEFQSFDAKNILIARAKSYPSKNDLDTRMTHKVNLKNLKPGTTYVYQVGNGTDLISTQGTFRTASEQPEPFTFLQITDTQGANSKDYSVWRHTLDIALNAFPDARFLLLTGDMVDNGQEIEQWDLFTDAVKSEFMSLPIEPVVGNHEAINDNGTNPDNKNFIDRFNLPIIMGTGAPSGTVYSFDYGYAHIAVLNTECSSNNLNKEADWMKADMDNSDKPWKIVALHRGPYGATYDSAVVRNALTPAFDEAGIDLVLQGHDHNYIRTYPMKNKIKAPVGKGTVYITPNSGGVKFYPVKPRFWQAVDLQSYTQMFLAVTVDKNTLKVQAYDVNNKLIDTLNLNRKEL